MYDRSMGGGVGDVIDDLVVGTDGASIVAAFAVLDRLEAKIAAAVASFDIAGDWAVDGSLSPQIWLRMHANLSRPDANRVVDTARRMSQLPETSRAWSEGKVSSGQVEAVCRPPVGRGSLPGRRFPCDVGPSG